MRIGIPKEIKKQEFRVSMTPEGVKELVAAGHTVLVEAEAGSAIGFPNSQYEEAGATIASTAREVFDGSDMIVKVKEPQSEECAMLRPDQTIFTYLHLAADKPQALGLMDSGCTAIAYETVSDEHGRTPLLAPMSRVAGRLSIMVAAYHLQSHMGGVGLLVSGVQEAAPAHVVVIGGGQAGTSAIKMSMGLGARTTVLDISEERLKQLREQFGDELETVVSSEEALRQQLKTCDVLIGATYIPGAAAKKLVTRDMLKLMRPGSIMVDISIDQGGCFETSKPTTHAEPTYTVGGIIHYCVANMPGAVARTSTIALSTHTLPFVKALAGKGILAALQEDPHLAEGLNVMGGHITNQPVAEALSLPYRPMDQVMAA